MRRTTIWPTFFTRDASEQRKYDLRIAASSILRAVPAPFSLNEKSQGHATDAKTISGHFYLEKNLGIGMAHPHAVDVLALFPFSDGEIFIVDNVLTDTPKSFGRRHSDGGILIAAVCQEGGEQFPRFKGFQCIGHGDAERVGNGSIRGIVEDGHGSDIVERIPGGADVWHYR